MKYTILDQRKNLGGKNLPNRARFLRRQKAYIGEAVRKQIARTSMKDIGNDASREIFLPDKTLHRPNFRYSGKGAYQYTLPGNKQYRPGDKIPIDRIGGGQGSGGKEGSPTGDEDGIPFLLTPQEFFDFLFDGCKLPDFVKKAFTDALETERVRAGVSHEGPLSKLHIQRTFGNSLGRRRAIAMPLEEEIKTLKEERHALEKALVADPQAPHDDPRRARLHEIDERISELTRRVQAILAFDDSDLRFKRHTDEPLPVSKAVVFCLFDVSASMGDKEMEIAWIFFFLLRLFLWRTYDTVVMRFLQHTTVAHEITEDAFFKTRRSGGTCISTAYQLMTDIIEKEYPLSEWNIYGAQCTDGENSLDDMARAVTLLADKVLPIVQYFAYAEITTRPDSTPSELWKIFAHVAQTHPQLAMRKIAEKSDIYPIFRSFFEQKEART